MVYAYIRQIPNVSHLVEQQRAILTFSLTKGLEIDKEVVEYSTKSLPLESRKEFENFLGSMQDNDTIIISSIEMLSDRAEELIKVINCVLSHHINLWIEKSNLLINKETKMVEIFPLLNALRQEEKEKTSHIGRPKGSKSSSKFDVYQSEILTLLGEGMSVSAIARKLEVSRSSLKDYIESRGIKDLVEGAWMEMHNATESRGMDNVVLICPFSKSKEKNQEKVS
jgi:DNA invertase Pin-like site-specific DNA recombinase